MKFLVLWLGTSIVSFGMEIANKLRIYKDAANDGYKIDIKKLTELEEQLFPNASKAIILSMLIPIFNLMQVSQKILHYSNNKSIILYQLSTIDALKEMSEIEKKEYLKNPTGLNALIVPLKSKIKLAKADFIETNDGSKIYYEIDKHLYDITILKVSGPASILTVEEQKKMIIETLTTIKQKGTEKYEYSNLFIKILKNNPNIKLSDTKDDKKQEETVSPLPQNLNISKQKQFLENLKNKLLKEKAKETVQSTQIDKKPTLSKKRK